MIFLRTPRYYDSPEGQDPVVKVVSLAKRCMAAGSFLGLYDCAFLTETKTAGEAINCFAWWIVPMVGMGCTWSSVAYMSTKFRGKDDHLNYAIAAIACSPILHAWTKTIGGAFVGTAALTFASLVAKEKHKHGWIFFPQTEGDQGIYEFDFTLTKDYDKDFRSTNRYQ